MKRNILIAFIGFAMWVASGSGFSSNLNFSASAFDTGAFFSAIVAIFFAYTGFQTITTFVAEIKVFLGVPQPIVGSPPLCIHPSSGT